MNKKYGNSHLESLYAEEISRILSMTKVGRIIYEEQMDKIKRIAENLIFDGNALESVSWNTGLDMEIVQDIARNVTTQKTEEVSVTA